VFIINPSFVADNPAVTFSGSLFSEDLTVYTQILNGGQ